MIDKELFIKDCNAIRETAPLVHNITNYVAMNFTANVLLAVGASPIMSFSTEEVDQVVRQSSSIVVNIGCLDSHQIKAMYLATKIAAKYGKPWVIDPVGAGMTHLRTHTSHGLIHKQRPAIVRCNASEILALARIKSESKGVDTGIISDKVVDVARSYAARKKCIVSVSGATDYITDGRIVETITNGHPMMPRVTAMGCSATALTAAFAAVDNDYFNAALNAMALIGVAGELAGSRSEGTGSFQTNFLNILSSFDPVEIAGLIKQ